MVVACFGLAFKANIDDLRESPSLAICEQVALQYSGRLLVVEPYIDELPTSLANRSRVEMTDFDTALKVADVLVLLVDHQQFKGVEAASFVDKVVIDTRGVWQ